MRQTPGWQSQVYFTPESVWDQGNPWLPLKAEALSRFAPQAADVLFVAGMDWQPLLPVLAQKDFSRPIINLIQHVRHADPALPLYGFLQQPAIRICVSVEVQRAIEATGRVNGPVVTIPNGIDLSALMPVPWDQRDVDVLIVGGKQPQTARALAAALSDGRRIVRVAAGMLRSEFIVLLARARTVVCLPTPTEGFYLPALEAMALGCLVICPDAVGNRSFCRDGDTCLMPLTSVDALCRAVITLEQWTDAARAHLRQRGLMEAARHDLSDERRAFQALLNTIDALWRETVRGAAPSVL